MVAADGPFRSSLSLFSLFLPSDSWFRIVMSPFDHDVNIPSPPSLATLVLIFTGGQDTVFGGSYRTGMADVHPHSPRVM